MSSTETNINDQLQVPPPKPFRRRLSFRTKPLSAGNNDPTAHDSLLSATGGGSGFNSVRGSIRRFRRVSGSVMNNNPSPPPITPTVNASTSVSDTPQTIVSTSSQPPHSPTFSKIQRFGVIALQQKSRLKEINISELKTVVEEKGAELGSKAAEFGSMAKETSFGWGKKGKEAVDRWKKKKEDPTSNSLLHPTAPQKYLAGINIFGVPLKLAVKITRIEKDRKCISKDPARYWLPAIMVRCLEFLDMHGCDEVGLYRIPGGNTTVTRMRAIFDKGADLNFLQSSAEDPHAVATLLKMYLRELPGPVLTEALVAEFNSCVTKHSTSAVTNFSFAPGSPPNMSTAYYTGPTTVPEELPRALAPIVSRLPPYEFYLLRSLCEHLARVDSKNRVNKMNLSNLGLIFCPNLGIGSILFKAFVGHLNIVFAGGCLSEERELAEEERERSAKEKDAPEVYRKTNISDDFSKSFEDLLLSETGHLTHPNNSISSSPSSSFSTSLQNKDNLGLLPESVHGDSSKLDDANVFMTVPSIKTTRASLSLSSSYSSSSSFPPVSVVKDSSEQANNPFSDDVFAVPGSSNNDECRQSQPTTDAPSPTSPTSSNPFSRLRSRSPGARNIPLNPLEFSSSSSDSSENETNPGEDDDDSAEPASPTLMTFDYFDKHGTKNLGVLNLSIRSSHQWVLHHNGVGGDQGTATAAWIRRRRPSLEEQEKWKRTLLGGDLSGGDESASEAGDGIDIDDEGNNLISRKKIGDDSVGVSLLGIKGNRGRENLVEATPRDVLVTKGISQVPVPVGDLINL